MKLEDHPWGRIVKVKGFQTKVYHITEGFKRKAVQDLFGTSPSDDASAAIFWDSK